MEDSTLDEKRVPAESETNGVDVDLMLTGMNNGVDFSVVGSPKGLADLIRNLTPTEAPAKADEE